MISDVQGTLDDAYLTWLYSHVAAVTNRNPRRSYWKLLRQLYTKEFVWFIPNDDNRVEDGKELRLEFLEDTQFQMEDPRGLWMEMGCSVLEMLIALARRIAFETEKDEIEWFWHFMHNLELDRYSDDLYEVSIEEEVEEALDRVVYRTYSDTGVGGLFPLRDADFDQRKVELWYQMSNYILEGLYVNVVPRA